MTDFDLQSTFLALDGQGGVAVLPVGPEFWQTIGSNPRARGSLVGIYPMTVDWDHWEMHPKGDEVLVMLDGRLELRIERDGQESRVEMGPGATCVVPAGAWHTARVLQPGRLLGITYGEGTSHRPLEARA